MRKTKPKAIHDMARRRGLRINKAGYGGWYIQPVGLDDVLYCAHTWLKIRSYVVSMPILIMKKVE